MNQIAPNFYTDVETEKFAARVSVASTLPQFLRAVREEVAYSRLVRLLREVPEAASAATKRIAELANREIDPNYSHPFDAALSAYILALAEVESIFLKIAATLALHAPQTWWSRQVCLELLKPASTAGERTSEQYSVAEPTYTFAATGLNVMLSESDFRSQQLWISFGDVLISNLDPTLMVDLFSNVRTSHEAVDLSGTGSLVSIASTHHETDYKPE
jgi:hypothetical protein